jgi:hypothetical protein
MVGGGGVGPNGGSEVRLRHQGCWQRSESEVCGERGMALH